MSVFTELAQLTVGISTPHFLYLNEATAALLESGAAGEAAAVLEAIDGNSQAIENSSLPPRKGPQELLLHLSQSNAYHRQLGADSKLSAGVFSAYRVLSRIPFHERLAANAAPGLRPMLYHPAEYNPVRGIGALWSSVDCRNAWARIPGTDSSFENVIDLFQPPMHLLVGGLMTYFAMMEQREKSHLHGGSALDWFRLMEEGVFKMIRHGAEYVMPRIHDLWSGAAVSVASPGSKLLSIIDAQQLGLLLTVLTGIDCGLHIFSQALLNGRGMKAIQIGTKARELQEQHTTPLLERIMAVAEGSLERDKGTPRGGMN